VVLDVSRIRETRAYHWLEQNPVTTGLVGVGLGAAAIILIGALGLYTNETFVTKTPCSRNPASKECAEQRQAVARKEPLKNPCISVQRVTGTKGRNCKRFYVKHGDDEGGQRLGGQAGRTATSVDQVPGSTPTGGGGSSNASGPPKSGPGGATSPGTAGNKGIKKHTAASEPQPEPAPDPSTEASTSSPPPEEEAGSSGETPAAQNSNGVKACLEVAVSACADVRLPEPHLP